LKDVRSLPVRQIVLFGNSSTSIGLQLIRCYNITEERWKSFRSFSHYQYKAWLLQYLIILEMFKEIVQKP